MNLLSIDFGLKHFGLAISHGILAEPLIQFANDQKALKKIVEICQKEKIEKIILGLSENQMAENIKNFAKVLEKKLNLPIIFQDETLTSITAKEYLIQSGAKKKKRRIKNHQIAAAIILQSYLDEN